MSIFQGAGLVFVIILAVTILIALYAMALMSRQIRLMQYQIEVMENDLKLIGEEMKMIANREGVALPDSAKIGAGGRAEAPPEAQPE